MCTIILRYNWTPPPQEVRGTYIIIDLYNLHFSGNGTVCPLIGCCFDFHCPIRSCCRSRVKIRSCHFTVMQCGNFEFLHAVVFCSVSVRRCSQMHLCLLVTSPMETFFTHFIHTVYFFLYISTHLNIVCRFVLEAFTSWHYTDSLSQIYRDVWIVRL